jgi:hypothetical protein
MIDNRPANTTNVQVEQQKAEEKRAKNWVRVSGVLAVVGFISTLVIIFAELRFVSLQLLWLIVVGTMLALLVFLGARTNYRWFGTLIDARNRTSLSRLQIIMWTVLALSAFLALAIARIQPGNLQEPTPEIIEACEQRVMATSPYLDVGVQEAAETCDPTKPAPLNIVFPIELIAAMGISTASLAGAAVVKSSKANKTVVSAKLMTDKKVQLQNAKEKLRIVQRGTTLAQVEKEVIDLTNVRDQIALSEDLSDVEKRSRISLHQSQINDLMERANEIKQVQDEIAILEEEIQKEDTNSVGVLKINEYPWEATLGDIFQGDEISNYQRVDLSKVQMFFFTVVLIAAYSYALWILSRSQIVYNPFILELPAFSASMVALLGISHAGYLTVKAVPQSQEENF